MSGLSQAPQYQAVYRACIKDAAGQGAALMQATLRRALDELPAQADAISDPVERSLLLEALAVAREQQQALAHAFPQVLLAEMAQAIAGDRTSALGFDALPLLADEQLQDHVHLVRAAQVLQEAVQPQLDAFEALLDAAQLAPAGDAQRHPLRPEVYVRALYRLARQSPVAASVRRRWLRYLPLAMAPELARTYVALAGTLRAQGVQAPEPRVATAAAPTGDSSDRASQLTIRELKQLLAGEPTSLGVLEPSGATHPSPTSRRPFLRPSRPCRTCARWTSCCCNCGSARPPCRTAPPAAARLSARPCASRRARRPRRWAWRWCA